MENTDIINPLDTKIQGLLDLFLKVRSAGDGIFTAQEHLDEDTLSVFIEGNIKEREAKPVILHLIDCSFCRNITSELIKLDLAFESEAENVFIPETQPTKIADVLSGILTRIFGSNEGAVFAHHEDESPKVEEKNENQGKE